jgi:hypothetical protein
VSGYDYCLADSDRLTGGNVMIHTSTFMVRLRGNSSYLIAEMKCRFLREIGTAEMEHGIERKVVHLSKKFKQDMIEETGIKPSLNDEEIKECLQEVINQIRPRNNGK